MLIFQNPVNLFCASIFSTNVIITSTLFCFSVPCKYYRYVFVFNSAPKGKQLSDAPYTVKEVSPFLSA